MPEVGLTAALNDLYIEETHRNYLFPEDSDELVTFTAPAVANAFSNWIEIVDGTPVTFSSKITDDTHISSITAESASDTDKVYHYEISYGDAKELVATGRLLSGNVRISTTQQVRMRNLTIPTGETVYYRVKCEQANATITVSFRYHYHSGQ